MTCQDVCNSLSEEDREREKERDGKRQTARDRQREGGGKEREKAGKRERKRQQKAEPSVKLEKHVVGILLYYFNFSVGLKIFSINS